MATTETAAIIMKGTTEQNKTKLDGFSYAHPENQFCFVLLSLLYNNLAVSC